jgi:peptidoglycan hydrolase FlgJ
VTDIISKIGSFKALSPMRNPRADKSRPDGQELERACHQFESLFVKYMLQSMRQTIPENELFGGGQAEKIYTEMLDDQVAQSISEKRGMGLAAMMYAQMASSVDKDGK